SRIRALWLKADLFTDLGLLEDAKRVIEELGKASSPDDPRILFAMGQCLAGLDDVAGGRTRLSLIPRHSSQYGAAQISLAVLDERAGDVAGARDRLEKLASDRILAADAIRALIETGVRHKDFD